MSSFLIQVLGVGDAFSEFHNPSALLLMYDGFCLGIDCPDMYRKVLRQAGKLSGTYVPIELVDHFLITHIHGDHVNGLESVAFYKHFFEKKHVNLVASPQVLQVIWKERLQGSMNVLFDGRDFVKMNFGDYFDIIPLSWDSGTIVGPFKIHAYPTRHHIPTSAVLVEAAGKKLGYSSDTAFDPKVISFLSEADLIIHETNVGSAHTAYASLLELPENIRKKMRLIHYPDGFRVGASKIAPLHEGELLRL
jgi:ribonuclease BN (tRNA processing enzyme)